MAADPNDLLLSSIRGALSSETGDTPLFALGGIIDSLLPSSFSMTKGSRPSPTYRSPPIVTIRWETSDSYDKVSLPFLSANDKNSFEKLVSHHSEHCIESFNVDFHPHDYGVVDTVARVLAAGNENGYLRVKVHLTALDIYGPSHAGPFSDVDRLCSDQEFASLVVCLPLEHDGGLLTVRRRGKEENFDWAAESAFHKIQWAAFLRGSEAIQSKITRGHRVTLTYSLSWTTYGMGAMASHLHILDEKSFTWYKVLRNAINKMDRKEEVLLGFTCTSVYPHVSMAARDTIHHILEGEDMVIYQILKRLATDTRVDMILDDKPVEGRQHRRGARAVIADSQEDESQLFDDRCRQPDAQDPYTIPNSQLESSHKTRLADPDPLGSVKWLNHDPRSAKARKNPVVACAEPDGSREARVHQASFIIVATLSAQRNEPHHGQKRKRSGSDKGNRMILEDGYATITKMQGDAYNVTVVRKGVATKWEITKLM